MNMERKRKVEGWVLLSHPIVGAMTAYVIPLLGPDEVRN